MGITKNLYDAPLFTGGATSAQVPSTYTVALNGRPYIVDFEQPFYRQYKREVAPLLRTQADVGTQPGEHSIDPNDLWRRSQEDWSLGAGQRYLDRKDSLPNRYWQSKGVDIWTKWRLGLLPDTNQMRASTNTNLAVLPVSTFLYIVDGSSLLFTNANVNTVASPTFTTVTGTPGTTITSICTDGFNVWFACGASGVYTTTMGAAGATQLVTTALDATAIVAYVNGRLMVAWKNAIYNVTSTVPAALPAALFTQGNVNWKWVGFAAGPTQIYMAGFVGDRSLIYGTATLTDGTALAAPIVQGSLPPGETITSIFGEAGFLFVGSLLGARFCTINPTTGAITLQALIPTSPTIPYPTNGVLCFAGIGRFVTFGWTNYDTASTGLGRMDIQNFAIDAANGSQPAYASDLMVTGQGAVQSVGYFQNVTVFAVSGLGFYAQWQNLVASGTLDGGYILYDLPDTKVAILLNMQSPVPLPAGSYKAFLSADGGTFMMVGTHTTTLPDPVIFTVNQVSAQRFEVRIELDRDATLLTISPTISRYTLRSWPAPKRPITWQLPLLLNETILNNSSSSDGFSPLVELQALESMATSGNLVVFQEGKASYSVLVSDVTFFPNYTTEDRSFFNGMALVQIKGIPI